MQNVQYVGFHPRAKMHAGFFIASILTLGLAVPIWIVVALVTRNHHK